MGVQYSLWGGSVLNLGTERHRKQYFDDIDRFRLPGEDWGARGGEEEAQVMADGCAGECVADWLRVAENGGGLTQRCSCHGSIAV